MSLRFKLLLLLLLTTALACGFMHHIVPPQVLNFERLHIFLFNLCVGGTLLIYFTEGQKRLSTHGKLYCLGSLLFALTAFLEWYPPTLFLPLGLAVITERVRVLHLGHCIPVEMLRSSEPVAKKFHQAALLCLSLALIISSLVILNAIYLHYFTIPKLTLDTFFLGFSFPLSLISMSVIFSLMQKARTSFARTLKEISFWIINLGVIIFFIFILAGLFIPQVIIASTLFITVGLVFFLYISLGIPSQQKNFLLSGILFLLCTSITGIIYILLEFSPLYNPENSLPLLRMHAFMALYGWNLSGLAVAARHREFPLQLQTKPTIALHWITVVILCPLGYFFAPVAIVAVLAYSVFLYQLLFGIGEEIS
ncbi:hypothetical protein [Desulfotalea psychrophila]|uniref:Uncharacterized protein n=1 Tax=Desulfotalea psychrophila (strain LSv54 / DSM 12343) TaxID=177439 RepID=Q6ANU1_DESPS|nr:hypothetical protein [Desulfotalea psychrophila]CAG35983.1 unknown protein [Desulfotalea psychrophila LSv54]